MTRASGARFPSVVFAMSFLAFAASASAADGVTPVSDALCLSMRSRGVMRPQPAVPCARLALVRFSYLGFDGRPHDDGQVVVLDAVADSVRTIFAELREARFPVASARLMDDFGGNDDASMDANNTSAFNDRAVLGSAALSVHALGCAIDLNPVQNPYVRRLASGTSVEPRAGAPFVDRRASRPGMAEAAVRILARHGFDTWGGRWRSPDYQHFQVSRELAQRLVAVSAGEAKRMFADHVRRSARP